jgi:uroporphyrinogen-III synthase
MGSSNQSSQSSQLSGQIVLVTRPQNQHEAICTAINEHGGKAIHFPLFAIEPIDEAGLIQQIKTKIENLDNYQLVIFVSTNAVKFGTQWINDYWPQFPLGVAILAIGPSTAKNASLELNCKVIHSDAGASSEDILSLDELMQVDGKKVALVRGVGGRELLADSLRQRGAEVDYIEVYRRTPMSHSSDDLDNVLAEEKITTLTVTSGESLERLGQLLKGVGKDALPMNSLPLSLPLIVPSNRVAQQAEQLGFCKVILASGAGVEATINALQELAN